MFREHSHLLVHTNFGLSVHPAYLSLSLALPFHSVCLCVRSSVRLFGMPVKILSSGIFFQMFPCDTSSSSSSLY